jgi:5-methyltetrahydrofolate--homocysteine methyltransferase
MTKQEFHLLAKNQIVFLDGATGSNLINHGMPMGVCPEQWILENQQHLYNLQAGYSNIGCHIVYAPTFTCNRIKLEEYGLVDNIKDFNYKLVALTKSSVHKDTLVAGNLTMTGRQLVPVGNLVFEDLVTVYKEQVGYLIEAGVDLFVVETMMSLQEARAAVLAIKELCDLPILVTFTFEKDGRTLFGTDAATAAIVMESLGVDGIGANCSTGPAQMINLIETISKVTTIPVIAKPNAGLPALDEYQNTIYDLDSIGFAKEMELLYEAGATILGGCCGTTIQHMDELIKHTKYLSVKTKSKQDIRYLTSERKTFSFELEDSFVIVGERINPTGKKKLQEELRRKDMNLVMEMAEMQEEDGASILDVNMGMSGIDEKELMILSIEAIQTVSNLPLSIDSSHIDVIEAALRIYPGRALINSISYERDKCIPLLKLTKKYGAMFVLLPLSDLGLPDTIDEKKEIIEAILKEAFQLGLTKSDIIVDGLVTTIATNNLAALETIQTIKYCKEQGLATTCGLSNISFGLPEREIMNATFLTAAIGSGLTMAIANPNQQLLAMTALASNLIYNRSQSDLKYIDGANHFSSRSLMKATKLQEKSVKQVPDKIEKKGIHFEKQEYATLYDIVLKGRKNLICKHTEELVLYGNDPQELLSNVLLPAINEVGYLFELGKYFLPQLIASAETMKLSIQVLEPYLIKESGDNLPVVVIATVQGDIHDIGKNLVALMLKNYGFQVVDLGKDVKNELIIEKAKELDADIIALSALMTTTMQQMKQVIDLAKKEGIRSKIMIGGAVITPEYAAEIGADGYSKDAAEAVKVAKKLMGIEI